MRKSSSLIAEESFTKTHFKRVTRNDSDGEAECKKGDALAPNEDGSDKQRIQQAGDLGGGSAARSLETYLMHVLQIRCRYFKLAECIAAQAETSGKIATEEQHDHR